MEQGLPGRQAGSHLKRDGKIRKEETDMEERKRGERLGRKDTL